MTEKTVTNGLTYGMTYCLNVSWCFHLFVNFFFRRRWWQHLPRCHSNIRHVHVSITNHSTVVMFRCICKKIHVDIELVFFIIISPAALECKCTIRTFIMLYWPVTMLRSVLDYWPITMLYWHVTRHHAVLAHYHAAQCTGPLPCCTEMWPVTMLHWPLTMLQCTGPFSMLY